MLLLLLLMMLLVLLMLWFGQDIRSCFFSRGIRSAESTTGQVYDRSVIFYLILFCRKLVKSRACFLVELRIGNVPYLFGVVSTVMAIFFPSTTS